MNKPQMMKSVQAAALAVSLALGAAAVQAMPGGHGGHGPQGGPGDAPQRMGMMLDLVDASEAQHKQIRELMQAARKDLQPQHEAMRKLHAEQRALLAAPSIDAAAVEAKRKQLQAQHELVSKRMSQAMIDAARVLTPEQRAKLNERMAKHEARMAERFKDGAPKRGER